VVQILWDLYGAIAPYVKIIEYAIILVTVALGIFAAGTADHIGHFGRTRYRRVHTQGWRCGRELAQAGRPRSTITAECHKLVSAGLVTMARGRYGTVVALAGRPN
jgi:hypothetical protein